MRGLKRPLTMMALFGLLLAPLTGCTSLGSSPIRPLAIGAGDSDGPSGSLLSALDGGLIGRADVARLSRADRIAALQSEYRALEFTAPGDLVTWQGRGGLGGQVVASQPYRVGSQDCRQYAHTVNTGGGAPAVISGTACRNPDGSWTLLS